MCNQQTSNVNVAGVAAAATYTTHTAVNPFVPNVSILRFPTGIFEMHLYLPGVVSKVEIVPHDNYLLVRGQVGPRLVQDLRGGHVGALIYTDRGIGEFSRDVPICLAPGTEFVVLETRQEGHDYIVRYTVRNSFATGYCANNTAGAGAIPAVQPTIHNPHHGGISVQGGGAVQGNFGPIHAAGALQGGISVGGHGYGYNYGGYGHGGYVHTNPVVNTINAPRHYVNHPLC